MIDKQTFSKSCNFHGTKGLVIVGDKVLLYRRDGKTRKHPYEVDVPGGKREGQESPFDTFQREVKEEFGLQITRKNIIYSKAYRSTEVKSSLAFYVVAQVGIEQKAHIRLGDEGTEYMLMTLNEYLKRRDAWTIFQERTIEFMNTKK